MEQQTKKCPYCGSEIMAAAKKCKHCGKWLDGREDKNEAPAPQEISVAKEEPQTKKCPYCGEEILIVAKKCKCCGEWVIPQEKSGKATATEDKPEELPEGPVDTNIPKYVNTFYWLMIIGSFITTIHSAEITTRAKGKAGGLIALANSIPEEIGSIIEVIGVIGLFVLLMRLTKKLGNPMDTLCGSIIAFEGILTICNICGIIENEAMLRLAVYAVLLEILIIFMLGLRLNAGYRNSLKTLGIGTMVWAVYSFFFFIIMLGMLISGENPRNMFITDFIIDIIYYYFFKTYLMEANNNPQRK